MAASKTESQKVFEKLKTKPANKVGSTPQMLSQADDYRLASIVVQRTQPGLPSHSASIFASIARQTTAILACTSLLSAPLILTVCAPLSPTTPECANKTEWQWEQLRLMKVGGNESATKYFQTHGGSAALASKDPKVKYTSNAATKYKEELKRRAKLDAQEYAQDR